jgi:hypothetical protein
VASSNDASPLAALDVKTSDGEVHVNLCGPIAPWFRADAIARIVPKDDSIKLVLDHGHLHLADIAADDPAAIIFAAEHGHQHQEE